MAHLDQIDAAWQTDSSLVSLPGSFKLLKERFLDPLGKIVTSIECEQESAEYGAIRFVKDGQTCLFRQAKHTAKKVGQFVTLWKRPTPFSEIAPYDCADGIGQVFIFVDEPARFGVFVFKQELLLKWDIFSAQSEGGKRAFRVYAPWTEPQAVQAKRSKIWQCAHFVELTNMS